MDKGMFIGYGTILAVVAGLVGLLSFRFDEDEYLKTHNCKLIHRNPNYTVMEYDYGWSMMRPKEYEGKKFYECDDGEWR